MGGDATADVPDASSLGEPPPLVDVLDDLAMRFVVNCPQEEQESFERLLFQVEAAFWFYEDQYREIWPHAFPSLTMLTFSQRMFASCPLLQPFEHRAKEIYHAFTTYKLQIPTCGGMLLNSNCTKLVRAIRLHTRHLHRVCKPRATKPHLSPRQLLVKSWKGTNWGFPKGKIDKDEEKVSCATREVLEEVGYDISERVDPAVYIETQWQQQTIRLYIVPGVPDDFPFETRTKKEIGEIAWHKIKELPSEKGEKGKFWMVVPFVNKLRRMLPQLQKEAQRKAKGQKKAAAPSAAPPPSTEHAREPPASAPAVATKSKRERASKGVGAAAPAEALPSSVQVLQRGQQTKRAQSAQSTDEPAANRTHPMLDFAFDRCSLMNALVGA